jgi:spore photoproduct lyase
MGSIKPWMPERVYFEPEAMEYPLGRELYKLFSTQKIPIIKTTSHNRITGIPGKTSGEQYVQAKRTLVVGLKKDLNFEVCKPSADYQFSLGTGCPASCEYCYLQTTQGKKPYIRVYVNLEDIFESINQHIASQAPNIVTFEAASTCDPLAIEHLTGSLQRTIEFFGQLEAGKLRVVTKYPFVDKLLTAKHNGNTHFRFSVNSYYVFSTFEHNTGPLEERIDAARKIDGAEYPVGFIIAPIMVYAGWKEEYADLLKTLSQNLAPSSGRPAITFELIQYRFTASAKKVILERFPRTKLDMEETGRLKKWGKYGRYKYVYPQELAKEIKDYMQGLIREYFPEANIEYFT